MPQKISRASARNRPHAAQQLRLKAAAARNAPRSQAPSAPVPRERKPFESEKKRARRSFRAERACPAW